MTIIRQIGTGTLASGPSSLPHPANDSACWITLPPAVNQRVPTFLQVGACPDTKRNCASGKSPTGVFSGGVRAGPNLAGKGEAHASGGSGFLCGMGSGVSLDSNSLRPERSRPSPGKRCRASSAFIEKHLDEGGRRAQVGCLWTECSGCSGMQHGEIDGAHFSRDTLEFIRLLEKHGVRYLLIGGEAEFSTAIFALRVT